MLGSPPELPDDHHNYDTDDDSDYVTHHYNLADNDNLPDDNDNDNADDYDNAGAHDWRYARHRRS